MPVNELSELQERLERRRLLAQQVVDAWTVEALRAEVAELEEKIARLEAKGSRPDWPKGHDHSSS